MIRKLLLVTSMLLLMVTSPTLAQTPKCDPATLISKAAALKSSGNQTKDLVALTKLREEINALMVACAPAKITKFAERKRADSSTGSYDSPVPFGEVTSMVQGEKQFEVAVVDSIRGAKAMQSLKKANQFNKDASVDREWVLMRVEVSYPKGQKGVLEPSHRTLNESSKQVGQGRATEG